MERAQAGDAQAFQTLIRSELPRVRRFARAFCSQPADADDVAQEALLKAFQAIGRYRLEARFSTWLYRIVRNSMIDWTRSAHQRRQSTHEAYEDGGNGSQAATNPTTSSPDRAAERQQLRDQLWTALQALPVEFRTVVVLFDVEGLSHEEIAEAEGIAAGTVKSRLSRGRKRLRATLVDKGVLPNSGNETDSGPVLREGTRR